MAFYEQAWYCNFGNGSTTGYYAVTVRPQNTAVAAGVVRRQFTAPAVGSERCFVCIAAGTTANVTDATWTLTRGSKTTDGTATWMECTGQAALNGDLTNTATWAQVKAVTPAVLGQIIKRSNNASYQICTTAGAMSASEPAFSDTAGVTTTDTTAVWTSLGAVGNFTGGQAPFARLASVFGTNWFAIGNVIYVGDNHAESQATAITINQPIGSDVSPARILCHNHSGSYPPVAADLTVGAEIATTSNVAININTLGTTYIYGLAFKAGVGSSVGTASINVSPGTNAFTSFDTCSFWLSNTAASNSSFVGFGSFSNAGNIVLNNCTVKFAVVTQRVSISYGSFVWKNTGQVLVSGSSVPTNFLALGAVALNSYGTGVFEGLDLSQLTGNLYNNSGVSAFGNFLFKDCKLNASMAIPQPNCAELNVQLVRCDSGATQYKSSRYAYEATETTETSITRVGGAADPTGQAQSRKIVTTANAQWLRPFKAEPYAIWNTVTGSNVTVTVYGTINAGAVPNNDDIWLEAEYLGSSAAPLGTIVTTTKATLLSANAAVASDNSSWNGGGSGAGWSPFKLTTTLSSPQPGLAGYLEARVRAAKASATYYIDPMPVLS